MQKPGKMTETLAHGYSYKSAQRELSNDTNMSGFQCFSKQKSLHSCALDKSSLSIARVKVGFNPFHAKATCIHGRKVQKTHLNPVMLILIRKFLLDTLR